MVPRDGRVGVDCEYKIETSQLPCTPTHPRGEEERVAYLARHRGSGQTDEVNPSPTVTVVTFNPGELWSAVLRARVVPAVFD